MSEPADSGKEGRKATVNNLLNSLTDRFSHEIIDVGIEDANRYWDSVSIYIEVRAQSEAYFKGVRKKNGYKIKLNLQSFAPRLYNFIENHSGVIGARHYHTPQILHDWENMYKGNIYLIELDLL